MLVVGARSLIFNYPHTQAITSSVPRKSEKWRAVPHPGRKRRGRAVFSIRHSMVTSATPASTMVKIFSGALRRLPEGAAVPFIAGFHAVLLFMLGASQGRDSDLGGAGQRGARGVFYVKRSMS
jgi:hypothetical protein